MRDVGALRGWSERFKLGLGTCLIAYTAPLLHFIHEAPGAPPVAVGIASLLVLAALLVFFTCVVSYVAGLYRGEFDDRHPLSKRETWAILLMGAPALALNAFDLLKSHFR